jgi:hypothetical protein
MHTQKYASCIMSSVDKDLHRRSTIQHSQVRPSCFVFCKVRAPRWALLWASHSIHTYTHLSPSCFQNKLQQSPGRQVRKKTVFRGGQRAKFERGGQELKEASPCTHYFWTPCSGWCWEKMGGNQSSDTDPSVCCPCKAYDDGQKNRRPRCLGHLS